MSGQLTRRALLAGTAGVAAGAVAGKEAIAAESKAAPQRAGDGAKRVIVLGAGLAGLCVAYEIVKARPGVQVTILEARDRVGGRVWTVGRDQLTGEPFDEGQYAELGAQRIPDTHARVLRYIKDFGLSSSLAAFSGVLTKYVLGAEQFFNGEAWPESLNLTDFERSYSLVDSSYEYEYKYAIGRKPPRGSNGIGSAAPR
jgi:Flavin containing amine oxidoreductase